MTGLLVLFQVELWLLKRVMERKFKISDCIEEAKPFNNFVNKNNHPRMYSLHRENLISGDYPFNKVPTRRFGIQDLIFNFCRKCLRNLKRKRISRKHSEKIDGIKRMKHVNMTVSFQIIYYKRQLKILSSQKRGGYRRVSIDPF